MISCFSRFTILSLILAFAACEPTIRPVGNELEQDLAFDSDITINADLGLIVDLDQTVNQLDFRLHDQDVLADFSLEPDADPWLSSACQNQVSPLLATEENITELNRKYSIKTGQALDPQKLIIHQDANLERDPNYLTLVGNQLHLIDQSSQLIWEQSTPGLSRLHGLYDFNGDGVLEVLASSSQKVYIYNLATGVELWHSELDDLFADQAFTSIYSVKVSHAFDELFPYLYVSDAGCSTAGTGYGIIYRFFMGFDGPMRQVITEPRQAGRCAKWHSLRRKDSFISQDEVYVLLTDQKGLHAFSADSGQRILCGSYGEDLIAGELPYTSLNNESWSWLSILNEKISYLGLRAYEDNDEHCESDEEVIAPIWQLRLPKARPRGLVNLDLNADGLDEIWINHQNDPQNDNEENYWQSSIIDGQTGRILAKLDNMVILSHLSWSVNELGESLIDVVVGLSPTPAFRIGEVAGDFQAIRVNLNQFNQHTESTEPFALVYEFIWDQPLTSVQPIWQDAALEDSPEFKQILKLQNNGERYLIFKRNITEPNSEMGEESSQESLISISTSGLKYELSSEYGWAYARALCRHEQDCDQIQAVESNGSVSILDSHLESESSATDPIELVTGINSFSLYLPDPPLSPRLATLSESGQLSVFALDQDTLNHDQAQPMWKRSVTALPNSQELGPHKPFITSGPEAKVIASQRKNPIQSTWLAYNLESGEEVWRHSLPSAFWYSEKQYFARRVTQDYQAQELVFRVERALSLESLTTLPSCEGIKHEYTHSMLFDPNPNCPDLSTTPRVIHALDAEDGSCLWRVILQENNPCSRPSLQNLSLLDLDQDGSDELYYLESDTLRVFDPLTGELLESETIPRRPDRRLVSGGWLKAFDGALLRFGTFSPPDLYQRPNQSDVTYPLSSLEPLWLGANIEGVRNQSWLRSWVALTVDGIWLRLGLNRPLIRYNSQGELDTILKLSVIDNPQMPNLASPELRVEALEQDQLLSPSTTITGLSESSNGGLIATNNEGGLFILDKEGDLQWGRHFNANPNLPLFSDWDADERQEWLLATDNGEINFYDQESYQGVTEIWESPCDQESQCSVSEDIDEILLGHKLCVSWNPLEDTQGYELQLQTQAGTAISEWIESTLPGRIIFNDPILVANNEYRIAIRTWFVNQIGNRVYTDTTYSDGFTAIDDQAPRVSIATDRDLILLSEVDERALQIIVSASDTAGLAGWNLLVYSEQNSLVQIIASATNTQQEFSDVFTWEAQDRFSNQVIPGRYKIIFAVSDNAGQQSLAESWVTVQ